MTEIRSMELRADIKEKFSVLEELEGTLEANIRIYINKLLRQVRQYDRRIELEELLEIPSASLRDMEPIVNDLDGKREGCFVDPLDGGGIVL